MSTDPGAVMKYISVGKVSPDRKSWQDHKLDSIKSIVRVDSTAVGLNWTT